MVSLMVMVMMMRVMMVVVMVMISRCGRKSHFLLQLGLSRPAFVLNG